MAQDVFITIVETPTFIRKVEKILTPDEYDSLIAFLATNPEAGKVIPNTGDET